MSRAESCDCTDLVLRRLVWLANSGGHIDSPTDKDDLHRERREEPALSEREVEQLVGVKLSL